MPWKRYTLTHNPSDDTYLITAPDGTVFLCDIDSCEELGLSEEFIRMMLPSTAGMTKDGITHGETIGEVNGFLYCPMDYYGLVHGFTAVGGGAMLTVFITGISAEDIAAYEALLGVLRPVNAEEAEVPADPAIPASFAVGDIVGYYDLEMLGKRHTDTTLILTPGGHGRLSYSFSSAVSK